MVPNRQGINNFHENNQQRDNEVYDEIKETN